MNYRFNNSFTRLFINTFQENVKKCVVYPLFILIRVL